MGKTLSIFQKITTKVFALKQLISIVILLSISVLCKAQFEAGNVTTNVAKWNAKEILLKTNARTNATTPALTLYNGFSIDSVYTPQQDETSKKIRNIVYLKLNEKANIFIPADFSYSIDMKVEYWPVSNPSTRIEITSKILKIDYHKNAGTKFNPVAYFTLPESERVKLTINNTTFNPTTTDANVLNAIDLENVMEVTRYFNMSTDPTDLAPLTFGADCPDTTNLSNMPDEMQINWSWKLQAHNNMTHLEWAWVENEMVSAYVDPVTNTFNPNLLFSSNSTRVDLDARNTFNYKVPLLYDGSGKLFYRIRPAYKKNDGSVITGAFYVKNQIN